MLAISGDVSPLFKLALILAHETGHRIGSIRQLRWSDVDFEHGKIRWRAENDKIGYEHETVVTQEVLNALERTGQARPSIGDAWIFPAPGNPAEPCSRHLVRDWWQRAEALAGVPHLQRLGWHSLRRKFATELKQTPLKTCAIWADGRSRKPSSSITSVPMTRRCARRWQTGSG